MTVPNGLSRIVQRTWYQFIPLGHNLESVPGRDERSAHYTITTVSEVDEEQTKKSKL